MNSYVISLIRTWVPVGVGAAAGWLLVHHVLTVSSSEQAGITALLAAAITAAYYAGVRALEVKFPKFPWGVLLGHVAKPSYAKVVKS